MESHGLDMRHKAECRAAVPEARQCMEEHGLEYDGGSKQPYEMGAHTELAKSWMEVGSRNGQAWENGVKKEKRCQSTMDKMDFVTFAMMNVKHSVVHRPKIEEVATEVKSRMTGVNVGL